MAMTEEARTETRPGPLERAARYVNPDGRLLHWGVLGVREDLPLGMLSDREVDLELSAVLGRGEVNWAVWSGPAAIVLSSRQDAEPFGRREMEAWLAKRQGMSGLRDAVVAPLCEPLHYTHSTGVVVEALVGLGREWGVAIWEEASGRKARLDVGGVCGIPFAVPPDAEGYEAFARGCARTLLERAREWALPKAGVGGARGVSAVNGWVRELTGRGA